MEGVSFPNILVRKDFSDKVIFYQSNKVINISREIIVLAKGTSYSQNWEYAFCIL